MAAPGRIPFLRALSKKLYLSGYFCGAVEVQARRAQRFLIVSELSYLGGGGKKGGDEDLALESQVCLSLLFF